MVLAENIRRRYFMSRSAHLPSHHYLSLEKWIEFIIAQHIKPIHALMCGMLCALRKWILHRNVHKSSLSIFATSENRRDAPFIDTYRHRHVWMCAHVSLCTMFRPLRVSILCKMCRTKRCAIRRSSIFRLTAPPTPHPLKMQVRCWTHWTALGWSRDGEGSTLRPIRHYRHLPRACFVCGVSHRRRRWQERTRGVFGCAWRRVMA